MKRRAFVAGAGTVIAGALAACVAPEGSATSTRVDSAGISIVTSTGNAWGEQEGRIDTTPLLRIGEELDGPYQFSFVPTALLLADGGVAVLEASVTEIRLFDADGRHVRSLGRRGQGPGEFQTIAALLRMKDDSLVAFDQMLRRVTVFSLAGGEPRVVQSQAKPRVRGMFSAFGAFGNGQLVLYNPGGGFRPDLTPGLQWDTTDIVVLDPTDGSARTIARQPSRQQFVLQGGDTKPLAPAHNAVRATTTDGFYWGTSDRYEIRFFDMDGNLRRILRRPVEPRPVEPAMIEKWININLEEVKRTEGEARLATYRRIYGEGPFGDRVPLFDWAFVDGDSRLWVRSSPWPADYSTPRRWSMFGPRGDWLGDLEVPPQLRIVDSRDGIVLGIWHDEGEAPFVQIHRLIIP